MRNILLFKLRYLGDVLLTTPSIRLVRKSFPDAHITMVVNQGTEAVLLHNPHLDRVLTVKRGATCRLLRALRERRYDVSVDFASGDRAAWLSLLSGVPRRIGLATPKGFRRFIHTQQMPVPQPQIHAVELYLALAREALGVTTEDKALELHTSAAEEQFADDWLARQRLPARGFAVAHVGGRYRENRWPVENWRRLIEAMPVPVVFIGAAQDGDDTRAAIAGTKALSLVGETSVLQLAAVLRRAAVFVGHDSGPMHIATAMGTKVVAFFGPASHPDVWRPWGEGHVVLPTSSSVAEVISASVPKA